MLGNIGTGLIVAAVIFFLLIVIIALIKWRYEIFTNNQFVLFFRNGKLRNQGYGGGYFLLPFIDELIVLSTTIQNLEIDVAEKIITSENQDVKIDAFIVWRIEDPVLAYQSISGGGTGVMHALNKTLEDLVESIIRTTVASLTLDQVLRERGLIIEAIMEELLPVVSPMGIKINTAEIRHVEVLDRALFDNLQEKYRQEARLKAEKIKIETDREVAKSNAQKEQDVRLYQASQEEKARVRELEKDRMVLVEQQRLEETDEQKRIAVEALQKEREAKIAEMDQKKLEIEANTELIQKEIQAETRKIEIIRQQIEVEAAKQTKIADAEAEARKTEAAAKKEAARLEAEAEAIRIEKIAEANKQAALLEAEAEALKISKIAAANKEALLAEAEGRKALLLAEAEGLREKVKAQGFVNDAMIMQDLVKQLPQIASSMKVGDINWLNMGGGDGNGQTPLGIIPKNLLEVMTLSKSFGLDIENLMRSIRGKDPIPRNGNHSGELVAAGPITFDRDVIMNAIAVDEDGDGDIDGFDTDGDGDVDFRLPENVNVVLYKSGKIRGLDLNGDGKVDFRLPKENFHAVDSDNDGVLDGLTLENGIEVDLTALATLS